MRRCLSSSAVKEAAFPFPPKLCPDDDSFIRSVLLLAY
jgi:hypothetical protein